MLTRLIGWREEVNYRDDQTHRVLFLELMLNGIPYTATSFIGVAGNFLGVQFVSHLGPEVLAASNLTSAIQSWFNDSICTAVLSVASSAGQLKGDIDSLQKSANNSENLKRGKELEIGSCLRESWVFGLALSVPAVLFMLSSEPILVALRQDTHVAKLAARYFYVYLFGLPPMYMMSCNRKFSSALNDSWSPVAFNLLYQASDTGLSYLLVNGTGFFPRLGFEALAWSNTLTAWGSFIFYVAYLIFSERYRPYKIANFRFDNFSVRLKHFLIRVWEQSKIGLPLAAKVALEMASLLIAGIIIGAISVNQLAAQEVSLQYIYLQSTLMWGVVNTVLPRASRALQAGNLGNAKKIVNLGIGLAVSLVVPYYILSLSIPRTLINVFIDTADKREREIVDTASILLAVNALAQMGDSIRNVSLAGLSGYPLRDRLLSTLYIFLILAFVTLPLSYLFGFTFGLESMGVMLARATGISLGAMLIFNFWNLKEELPAPTFREVVSVRSDPFDLDTDHSTQVLDNEVDAPQSSWWGNCWGCLWGRVGERRHLLEPRSGSSLSRSFSG